MASYCAAALSQSQGKTGGPPLMDPIFERLYPALLAWCRRHVRREFGEPEDFVHQAYLRCRQRWSPARKSVAYEAAYFYRALRWVVADVIRRELRRCGPALADSLACPCIPDSPLRELIAREALDRLPRRQRAVCLGLLQGKREDQLCAELRVSAPVLAVYLWRARRRLRQTLGLKADY
jgi:DNA-directed RNA polymerase specialized sigma24 family protein